MNDDEQEGPSSPQQTHQPQPALSVTPKSGSEGRSLGLISGGLATANEGDPMAEFNGDGAEKPASTTLDQARIDARVKGLYKELLEAPVPDDFLRLIEALDKKERNND